MLRLSTAIAALALAAFAAAQGAAADPAARLLPQSRPRVLPRAPATARRYSFMQPWERRMNIYVQPVGSTAEPVRITSEKDRDIPTYFWKGADRVVYLKDIGGDENDHVVVVGPPTATRPRDLTPFARRRRRRSSSIRCSTMPNRMLVGLNRRDARRSSTSTDLDLASGDLRARRRESRQHHRLGYRPRRARSGYAIATDGVEHHLLCTATTQASPFKPVLTTSFQRAASRRRGSRSDNQQALRRLEPRPRQGRDRARRPGDREGGARRLRARRRTTSRASSSRRSARC